MKKAALVEILICKRKEKQSSRILLTQKSTHWNPRASIRQAPKSQPSVPVNLTCNWQGINKVKSESVSTGIPNVSQVAYRQGSADTENDNRSGKINVY